MHLRRLFGKHHDMPEMPEMAQASLTGPHTRLDDSVVSAEVS
jgi:hypothetical protein